MRSVCIAFWITEATEAQPEYVIVTAVPRDQYFVESTSIIRLSFLHIIKWLTGLKLYRCVLFGIIRHMTRSEPSNMILNKTLFVINYVELTVLVVVNILDLKSVQILQLHSTTGLCIWALFSAIFMSFLSLICMQVAAREMFRFPLLHENGCGFTALTLTCRPSSTIVTATLFIIRSELITRKVWGRNTFLTSVGLLLV
jgi:hypothetical protein